MAGKIYLTGTFVNVLDLDELKEEYEEGSTVEEIVTSELQLLKEDPHGCLSDADVFETSAEVRLKPE